MDQFDKSDCKLCCLCDNQLLSPLQTAYAHMLYFFDILGTSVFTPWITRNLDSFHSYSTLAWICRGNSRETRGTAFVVYEDIYDAKNATDHLSGFNVCGRYLIVLYYQVCVSLSDWLWVWAGLINQSTWIVILVIDWGCLLFMIETDATFTWSTN